MGSKRLDAIQRQLERVEERRAQALERKRLLEAAEKKELAKAYRLRMSCIAKLYMQAGLGDTDLDAYPTVLLGAFSSLGTLMGSPGQREQWYAKGLEIQKNMNALTENTHEAGEYEPVAHSMNGAS